MSPMEKAKEKMTCQHLMDGSKDFRSAKPIRERASALQNNKMTRGEGNDMQTYYNSLQAAHHLMAGSAVLVNLPRGELQIIIRKAVAFEPNLKWSAEVAFSLLEVRKEQATEDCHWHALCAMLVPFAHATDAGNPAGESFNAEQPVLQAFGWKAWSWKAEYSIKCTFDALRTMILDGENKHTAVLALAQEILAVYESVDLVCCSDEVADFIRLVVSAAKAVWGYLRFELDVSIKDSASLQQKQ